MYFSTFPDDLPKMKSQPLRTSTHTPPNGNKDTCYSRQHGYFVIAALQIDRFLSMKILGADASGLQYNPTRRIRLFTEREGAKRRWYTNIAALLVRPNCHRFLV
jgi:hypothetical protein